jgi:hypothetical protein
MPENAVSDLYANTAVKGGSDPTAPAESVAASEDALAKSCKYVRASPETSTASRVGCLSTDLRNPSQRE